MATPRSKLVDEEQAREYHLVSRCVRRAYLCGWDRLTRRDYSHRKRWVVDRLELLGRCFAVEVHAYAVLDNHVHIVVTYDPKACKEWSDEDVAVRWVEAFPPTEHGQILEERKPEARELLLGDPHGLRRARRTLGSLSNFMKHLKQPIARRANLEDGREGHFFEQRFYSGALLSDDALLAAMAYVDLNPVRAKLAKRIEECTYTSIVGRLKENSTEALRDYLRPVISGLAGQPVRLAVTLADYLGLLRAVVNVEAAPASDVPGRVTRWISQVSSLRRRQRAHGPRTLLRRWAEERGLRPLEKPLPV